MSIIQIERQWLDKYIEDRLNNVHRLKLVKFENFLELIRLENCLEKCKKAISGREILRSHKHELRDIRIAFGI